MMMQWFCLCFHGAVVTRHVELCIVALGILLAVGMQTMLRARVLVYLNRVAHTLNFAFVEC